MIRTRLLPVLAALFLEIGAAHAQIPNNTVRLGVLTDASGPFADQSGRGAFVAAQLAAEDFAKGESPPGQSATRPTTGALVHSVFVPKFN